MRPTGELLATPINVREFHHDGRGPELLRVHWSASGRVLAAIDYRNPDDSAGSHRHVEFVAPQVIQITPEEVINYLTASDGYSKYRPAAMLDLGRSAWLDSFNPQHLQRCRHFQLMFYDELIDIVCENVKCIEGRYEAFTV